MSIKRQRINEGLSLVESFGALYRQSTSRAMERLRLQLYGRENRGVQNSRERAPSFGRAVRPIDRLMIVFSLYFFYIDDLVPPHHYLRLAQDLITKTGERVKRVSRSFFEPVKSLALFCETLVEEYNAAEMEEALQVMEEIITVREQIGEYIVEEYGNNGSGSMVGGSGPSGTRYSDSTYYREEDEEDNQEENDLAHSGMLLVRDSSSFVTLLGRIYQQLAFFTHIHVFVLSLSRDASTGGRGETSLSSSPPERISSDRTTNNNKGSSLQSCDLFFHSRYERELLLLMIEAAGGKGIAPTPQSFSTSSPSGNDSKGTAEVKIENEEEGSDPTNSADFRGSVRHSDDDHSLHTGATSSSHHTQPNSSSSLTVDIVPLKSIQVEIKGEDDLVETVVKKNDIQSSEKNRKQVKSVRTEDCEKETKEKGTKNEEDSESEEEEQQRSVKCRESNPSSAVFRRATATALLGDLLALSHLPNQGTGTPTKGEGDEGQRRTQEVPGALKLSEEAKGKISGVLPSFYGMLHARLAVMVSRQQLHQFAKENVVQTVPMLTQAQKEIETAEAEEHLQRMLTQGKGYRSNSSRYTGVAVDYIPDQAYYERLLGVAYGDEMPTSSVPGGEQERRDEIPSASVSHSSSGSPPVARGLGEDEEIFTGELMDYYLRRRPLAVIQDQDALRRQRDGGRSSSPNTSRRIQKDNIDGDSSALIKPDRVCKVKTGYTWTQYNRTHYDSRTNPPPKSVMWYDFTLFYPALAKTKRNPLTFFCVEDTPKGPTDEYCLLVFSVGPPYADVAYRIERKQWDPRRGGVRISFDANGKFRLFFRFSNSNYRR